jgi:threonine/homoserine/homoserine lactone efflux protein
VELDLRLLTFVAVSALFIATPGPDTALIIRNALTGGPHASTLTAFGVALGSAVWAAAATFGIGVLLELSAGAFTGLKLAGAAYLCYLGVRTLLSSVPKETNPVTPAQRRDRSSFAQGLLSNLLNPKAGAFFVTVMPQFILPGDSGSRLAVLVATYEGMLLLWLIPYGHLVGRMGRSAVGLRVRTAVTRLTGAVLIGLGARLAFERR